MIVAFALMLLTLIFFNSSFYYEKILHKPYPYSAKPSVAAEQKSIAKETPLAAPAEPSALAETVAEKPAASMTPMPPARVIADTGKKADTLWVETENIICGISTAGANIISLQTKKYGYNSGASGENGKAQFIELVAPNSTGGNNVHVDNQSYDKIWFTPQDSVRRRHLAGRDTCLVALRAKNSDGSFLTKTYTFYGTSYKIGCRLNSPFIKGKNLGLGWECGLMESEKIDFTQNAQNYIRKGDLSDGKSVDKIQLKKEGAEEKTGFYRWFGMTSKYFLIAIVADTMRDMDISVTAFLDKGFAQNSNNKKGMKVFDCAVRNKINSDSDELGYWIYTGPTAIPELVKYQVGFEKVLFNGWEWFLWANVWFPMVCEWVLWLLIFLNQVFHDYGISIIVLTILSRVITYPLTQSSMKSMNRMKDLQPKINALRSKYKTNAKKMNEELMALYKKEGINPLNPGCLPMFLQMPVFIALYVVLQAAIELRGAQSMILPWVSDLSQPENVFNLGAILPGGIPWYGNHVAILPIIMAILTFFQNKMTIKDPNQKAMVYIMPIFMLVIFNNFSSGIVLYWTFSSALGILQQVLLDRSKKAREKLSPAPEFEPTGKSSRR